MRGEGGWFDRCALASLEAIRSQGRRGRPAVRDCRGETVNDPSKGFLSITKPHFQFINSSVPNPCHERKKPSRLSHSRLLHVSSHTGSSSEARGCSESEGGILVEGLWARLPCLVCFGMPLLHWLGRVLRQDNKGAALCER